MRLTHHNQRLSTVVVASHHQQPQQQQQLQCKQIGNNNYSKNVKNTSRTNYSHNNNNLTRRNIWLTNIIILIYLLAFGIASINAVPTDSRDEGMIAAIRLRRTMRDIENVAAVGSLSQLPDDATTKSASQTSSETTPKGQCLLDGVLVAETSVSCVKQVGCRAIQKTGHCCPDYKCDCEKDGKTYLNGDKLVDPANPCKVCYCKAGDIICSSVTCFQRDDCTPKYIPGRCCPEYDNCPISKPTPAAKTNATLNNAIVNGNSMPSGAALNLNITIKEITKPIEIRITDDNKIKPMIKPGSLMTSTTTTTTTTTTTKTTTTTEASIPTAAVSTSTTISTTINSPSAAIQTNSNSNANVSEDTNQKLYFNLGNVGVNNESLKLSSSVPYKSTILTSIDASLEDFQATSTQLDAAGNEDKTISIFNTQRVNTDFGNDSSKVNIKREGIAELNIADEQLDGDVRAEGGANVIDLEPETAGSDNIYHIILTTDGPRLASTTETYLSTTEGINNSDAINEASSTAAESYNTTESTEYVSISSTPASDIVAEVSESTTDQQQSSTTETILSSTIDTNKHHMDEEDSAIPVEANPAYPSLPEDDFSLRDVNFPLSETDDVGESEIKEESRSNLVFDALKNEKQKSDNQTIYDGSGSGAGAFESLATSTAVNLIDSISSSTTEQTVGNIALLYSAEDNSQELKISNNHDFKIISNMKFADDSDESIELENGSGSGSGISTLENKIIREREPTTPRIRPISNQDIDELSASGDDNATSPVDDPKLDVESLKLNENKEENLGKVNTGSKAQAFADKTIEVIEEKV